MPLRSRGALDPEKQWKVSPNQNFDFEFYLTLTFETWYQLKIIDYHVKYMYYQGWHVKVKAPWILMCDLLKYDIEGHNIPLDRGRLVGHDLDMIKTDNRTS